MTAHDIDIRAARLTDLPLMMRLIERSAILDSEHACTRDAAASQNLLMERLPLTQREWYTLIARTTPPVMGQFRLKADAAPVARLVYVAPTLDENSSDTGWLHLLDAMTFEAGRRGAHALTAEVDEMSPLFVTMRQAGFAVYARQQIWVRLPGKSTPPHIMPAALTPARSEDAHDIQALYCNIVPKLVQPVGAPPSDEGFVYRQPSKHGRRGVGIQAYIAASEGKNGVYMMPLLHPDILFEEASAILAGAIALMPRAEKLPLSICVRRYEDWLEETLIELGFEPGKQQALMVRHIAAGVRQPAFARVLHALEATIAVPVVPPTSRMNEP
jgi:hypothetical protein